MLCPQCNNETELTSGTCPTCGAPLPLAAAQPAPGTVLPGGAMGAPGAIASPGAARPAGTSAQFAFDVNRLSQADRIAGVATLVLFISLFLPWFGASVGMFSVSVNGLWHGWMYIPLILSLALMGYLVVRAGFAEMPFRLPLTHDKLLLAGTVVNAILTVLSFLLKPSGTGWQFGAFIGLIAAVVAALPFAVPAVKAKTSQR